MKAEFKPLKLTDLKLSHDDAKLIADGAAVFMAPAPDPADEERFLVDEPVPKENLGPYA